MNLMECILQILQNCYFFKLPLFYNLHQYKKTWKNVWIILSALAEYLGIEFDAGDCLYKYFSLVLSIKCDIIHIIEIDLPIYCMSLYGKTMPYCVQSEIRGGHTTQHLLGHTSISRLWTQINWLYRDVRTCVTHYSLPC